MTTPAIMIGLLVGPLLLVSILNRLTGKQIFNSRLAGCAGIMLVFCFTGIGHYTETRPMAEMLPPFVPARVPLVYVTGVIEIAAAITVLIPRLRKIVGLGLILMLVCFLPVNIYAAINRVGMGGAPVWTGVPADPESVAIVSCRLDLVVRSSQSTAIGLKAGLNSPTIEVAHFSEP